MRLAEELSRLKKDNQLAWLAKDHYTVDVTVLLRKNACWQGLRIDKWSFFTERDARRAKKIVGEMLKKHHGSGKMARIGADEQKWLEDYGGENSMVLWKVGKISRVTVTELKD